MYHFLLVTSSNNHAILHRLRDTTTFTVYVAACDLDVSFIFEKTIEVSSNVRFMWKHIHTTFSKVW